MIARALWNKLCPLDKISSIVFVNHSDPQLITGWAHGTTVLRNTWKNIIFPSNPHFNFRYVPNILNLTTDMTSKLESYRLHCRKYQTVPRTRVRVPFFDFFLIHNTHESWRMSNQEVANSRMLRNSITSLSPFPFKACSERIIDFHFLSSHKFSNKILAAISLRCIIGY